MRIQDVASANLEFSPIDIVKEKTDLANLSAAPQVECRPDLDPEFGDRRTELKIRLQRAQDLCNAIAATHPDDARQIMAAAMIDLSEAVPPLAVFGSVIEDARFWSSCAAPPHLVAVLEATLKELQNRAMCLRLRKKLFMVLWGKFTPFDRNGFLSYANDGGAQ